MYDEFPVIYRDINFLSEQYELNEIYHNIVKEDLKSLHAYMTIGDPQILTEGITNMAEGVVNFFRKMIEKIKEFFKKIMMFINAQFMEIDKFVAKYKKELDKIKKVEFSILGYKFTINEAPSLDPFKRIVDNYNAKISDVKKISKLSEIKATANKNLSDENLDGIRGAVLGTSDKISEDDFIEECRKYYRGGELQEQSIDVDINMYKRTIAEVPQIVKKKKDAEKLRDDVIILLQKTESFFDKKIPILYKNTEKKFETTRINVKDNKFSKGEVEYQDYSNPVAVSEFVRYMSNYTRTVSGIINNAMTEYVNAYKDQVKMCREIIKKGLYTGDTDVSSNKND